jgi:predicted DNA-binding transcriptional regulator AlpA
VSGELVVLLTDAQLDALAAKVAARLQNGNGHPPQEQDKLLTADEAAQVLGVKPRWLYGHASTLPFTVRLPNRAVRFSERGIATWLAKRMG